MADSQLHHSQQTKRIADDCSMSFLVGRRARNEPCCFLFGRLGYGIVYLLLISRARGLYWENIQERRRVIFSHFGPELMRVNKKFIMWLHVSNT